MEEHDPGFIRIPDVDRPIYRIFPLWFFERALSLKQLVLVDPRMWDDPWEDLCSSIQMEDQSVTPFRQKPLSSYLKPAYAQAWSFTGESDALLRAYSRVAIDPVVMRNSEPRFEGVKVRSSPRRLLCAARAWAETQPGLSFSIGAIAYGDQDKIAQHVVDMLDRNGPEVLGRGTMRAELLLLKRRAFAHESEVRLICIDERGRERTDLLSVSVDIDSVIEEVSFDPRLIAFERREREARARALGYEGPFGKPDLYQKVLHLVPLKNGWKGDAD